LPSPKLKQKFST